MTNLDFPFHTWHHLHMQTATLDDISDQGAAFLAKLQPSEPVTLFHDGKVVAVIVAATPSAMNGEPRPLGCYAGQIGIAADFDEPLPEWEAAVTQSVD